MTLQVSPTAIAAAWERAFSSPSAEAPDAIAALFAENGRVIHPYHKEPIVGREAIRQAHVGLFVGWEQSRMTIKRTAASDASVVVDWHFSSVQTGTRAPVELDAVSLMQLDGGGKIAEERRLFDVFMEVNASGKVEAEVRRQEHAIDYKKMAAEMGRPVDGKAGSDGEEDLEDLVREFHEAFQSWDIDRIVDCFTEDGVYEDRSIAIEARGRGQIRALWEGWKASLEAKNTVAHADLVGFAVRSSTAYSERNDIFESPGGSISVPVASVIEFENGKIKRMREFWDTATSGLPIPAPKHEANKATVRRFFEEALNQGNAEVVDELVAPGFVHHGGMSEIRGAEGMKEEVRAVAGSMEAPGGRRIQIEEMLADGDRVITRYILAGRHSGDYRQLRATGKDLRLEITVIQRIENGKIAEDWEQYNGLTMMQQLGLVATP